MNTVTSAIIPYIVPTILIIVGYVIHVVMTYIPAQQRSYIVTFAEKAVAYVEQVSAGKSDEEKKQMAMDAIIGFFKAFNLPIPPLDILSAFIEAAVNALPTPLQGGK